MLKDAGAQLLDDYLKPFTYYLISLPPPTNHAAGKLQSPTKTAPLTGTSTTSATLDHFLNLTINLTLESYYAQKSPSCTVR
jgi:hypothetical protein